MTGRPILYLSPNGIGTALVRSQVLPYLRELGARGYDVHLLTFERGAPFPDGEFPRDRWHPLRPRRGRHLAAKLADIASGVLLAWRIARRHGVGSLHARSYLPAAIAWAVSRLTGLPFVFDMRGFLGEEYVEGGIWSEGDLRYRALRLAERTLLRDASEVVVLTHAAARRLRTEPRYASSVGAAHVSVVPCAADLDRFRPAPFRADPPILVYSGSLGMWYLLDEMLRVYAHARDLRPDLRLRVLNRDEAALVRDSVGRLGLASAPIEIRAADFDDMPHLLGESSVAISLLKQVSSKTGSSPIKVAEYLACALPVVVNEGLGDTADLVRTYGAGHVVGTYAEDDLRAAARAVVRLIGDHAARANARRLAEEVYDVHRGAATYAAVHARMSAPGTGR